MICPRPLLLPVDGRAVHRGGTDSELLLSPGPWALATLSGLVQSASPKVEGRQVGGFGVPGEEGADKFHSRLIDFERPERCREICKWTGQE